MLNASSTEPDFLEGNCLIVNIDPDLTVVASYRPPSFKNTTKYLNSLENVLSTICSPNIVLTGDININTLDATSGSVQDYLILIAMQGLRVGITHPTRLDNCLDHFMVKTRKKWKTVVFEQPLTDHCPILLSIDCAALSTNVSNSKKVVLNYEGINSLLLKETWNDIYLASDANIAAELFTKKLLEIININKYFIDVRKKYRPLKPWITRGVVKSIVKRDKLHKQVKNSDSKESARKHYLTYRNTCNKIIKDLKKNTIRNNCPIDSLNVVNTHFASVGGILANNIMSKLNISEHELALKAKLNSAPLHSMAFLPTDPVEDCTCAILSRTHSIKYLGVSVDDGLDWKEHIGAIAARLRKMIYIFKNLRQVANHKLAIQTYRALCECLIRYCVCVWGGACKSHLITVEKTQRALLKIIMFLPYRHPTSDVYAKADVLSVRRLFILEALRRFHKLTVPLSPPPSKRVDRLPIPFVRSSFARRQYDVIAPTIYNAALKSRVIDRKTSNYKFKFSIMKWLKKMTYDEIETLLHK
ncbi:hypothetical protein HF086_003037 [Spodoptera exigua]|uniref:Endonuclease/exonuclease/phosphatase domain-containing protein n=1 Tax=Spodoptera exigua TaxID=7107 RepID=A0A922MQF6_SPOEX|nr:hypothetical protein HF086_003037 [Spodoptera exigua]